MQGHGGRGLGRRAMMLVPASALLLGACASGAPGEAPAGVGVERDIAYGPDERHRLDVHYPLGPIRAPLPVIVLFHGGFWLMGSKDEGQMQMLAAQLARRGAVAVLANYRLAPGTVFPGFVEDGARAIAWAADHAEDFGGDRRRVFAGGHSAGAHIAVMLAVERRFLAGSGVRLAGAVGIAGPYGEWFQGSMLVAGVFPPALSRRDSSPIALADGRGAPLLLLCGTMDTLVRPADTTDLAERVRSLGGRAEGRLYGGIGHLSIMGALPFLPSLAPVADDIAAFLRQPGPGPVA
jgi:acetyl esterase/lipase